MQDSSWQSQDRDKPIRSHDLLWMSEPTRRVKELPRNAKGAGIAERPTTFKGATISRPFSFLSITSHQQRKAGCSFVAWFAIWL